jgi:hypothetical protein
MRKILDIMFPISLAVGIVVFVFGMGLVLVSFNETKQDKETVVDICGCCGIIRE